MPDVKTKYRVLFAKNYLERQYLDHTHKPHFMKMTIQDPAEKVSVTEMNAMGSILLLGYMSGKIKAYYFD